MALPTDPTIKTFSWLNSPNAQYWESFVWTDPPRMQFLGPSKMPGSTVCNNTNVIGVKSVRPQLQLLDTSLTNNPRWCQDLPTSSWKIPPKLRMSHAHPLRNTRMQYW